MLKEKQWIWITSVSFNSDRLRDQALNVKTKIEPGCGRSSCIIWIEATVVVILF